jgi:hypothetical protein
MPAPTLETLIPSFRITLRAGNRDCDFDGVTSPK